MCKSEAMRGYRRSFGRWEYEMIWNFCGTTVSQPKREKKTEGRVTQKSISYGMRWAKTRGGWKNKKKGEKKFNNSEASVLCVENVEIYVCGKVASEKNLLLIFCAMVFRARFFLTSFETRQKFFPSTIACWCCCCYWYILGKPKKRKISAVVCCRMKKNVQHIVYHVRKRTHIFMKNLYGNSSSSNSNSCTQTVR